LISLFLTAFVTLFVVIDPPGIAPIFAGLVSDSPAQHQRDMAVRATGIAGIILVLFALFGRQFLGAMGVSLAAFRTAGGIMLLLMALEMVFEKRTERREHRADAVLQGAHEDISVFPMAMPMIAGPGSIASVMLLMSQSETLEARAIVFAALACVLAITLGVLMVAAPLMRMVGKQVENVITRILGVILAALAVQFVFDGIKVALSLGN
jgi:multiple antibiotic resistance protein